jgi:multiple sugar transport system substrate-binding protein
MKKKLAALLALTMVAGSLAACGGSTSTDTSSASSAPASEAAAESTEAAAAEGAESAASGEVASEPITIDFWNSWTGSDGDTLVAKVEEFNETNPWGITVNMDISAEFAEKLATTLPTGDCAPLILMGTGDRFRYSEYLVPIDDIWENTSLKEEDFNPNTMEVCKTDGTLYAIPFQQSLYYMYWNKDLFEQAGLDPESPPQSLEEWAEYASLITNEDTNTYGSGLFLSYGNQEMSVMGLEGGWAVTETEDGKWDVNIADNEGYKNYLTWMKELYNNGDNPVENEIDSMFKAGQIGIMVNGPWLAAGADESGINFGMCKIFGNEPQGDVAGFFVTNGATEEEKLACERFMQWWYTGNEGTALEDTGAGVWSLSIGFPTAYLPLAETEAYTSNERLSALALDDNSQDSLWITTDPNFKGWSETVTEMGNLKQSVVYDTPIDEALATAQANVEALVKTYEGDDALAE